MRYRLGLFAIGLPLVPVTLAALGGWAVITVEDLPEYLEAGRPTDIVFTVRQHGRTPMDDRSPSVTLKPAGAGWLAKGMRFPARHGDGPGRYVATITVADTGTVAITIDSDWGSSRETLMPLRVVRPGERVASTAPDARGRALFVAKGCVTCHVKQDDPALGAHYGVAAGPELTGLRLPAEWVAQKLADPARFRAGAAAGAGMPNLGLSEAEIGALARYVSAAVAERAASPGRAGA